jgi:hypothetical protein
MASDISYINTVVFFVILVSFVVLGLNIISTFYLTYQIRSRFEKRLPIATSANFVKRGRGGVIFNTAFNNISVIVESGVTRQKASNQD